jgi:RHS repeat-associated protein
VQQRSAITVEPELTYAYDSLSRLIAGTRPLPGDPLETYTYDQLGNRLLRDGQQSDAVFDAGNRLREDDQFAYAYDDNGNLTEKLGKKSDQRTAYTFTAENRLVRVDLPNGKVAEYRYDGLGRRIERSVDDLFTQYIYDYDNILFETDKQGTILVRYTHGVSVDEPFLMESGSEQRKRSFYHRNRLSSIVDLSNEDGALVHSYVYDSFGQIVLQEGAESNIYTFTGREFDPETSLYYYRARYLDPSAGRFVSEEPLGWGDESPYEYARSNPVNYIDPSGLVYVNPHVCAAIGAAVGLGIGVVAAGGVTVGTGGAAAIGAPGLIGGAAGIGAAGGGLLCAAANIGLHLAKGGRQGVRNELVDETERATHFGTKGDPCAYLAAERIKARRSGNIERLRKIVTAEKYYGCRQSSQPREAPTPPEECSPESPQ